MRRPTSAPDLEPNEDSKDNNVTFQENMSESKGFLESRKKSLSLKTQQRMYVDDFADFDCLKSPFSKAQHRMYVRRHVRRRLCGL